MRKNLKMRMNFSMKKLLFLKCKIKVFIKLLENLGEIFLIKKIFVFAKDEFGKVYILVKDIYEFVDIKKCEIFKFDRIYVLYKEKIMIFENDKEKIYFEIQFLTKDLYKLKRGEEIFEKFFGC